MTTRDVLLKGIQHVPEPLLQEVLDFIRFVQVRLVGGRFETAVASEPSLSPGPSQARSSTEARRIGEKQNPGARVVLVTKAIARHAVGLMTLVAMAECGCAAKHSQFDHFNIRSEAEVAQHLTVSPELASRQQDFAEYVVQGQRIVDEFAARHSWQEYAQTPFFDSVEIFETQAQVWQRILALHHLPADTKMPTPTLVSGLEKRVLLAVAPEEYERLSPGYACAEGAYVRILAHEIAHRLHIAILHGDEDAMGAQWFYEAFAVVASGDLMSAPLRDDEVWAALSRKDYRSWAAALRYFMTKAPLAELVKKASSPDFKPWLRQLTDTESVGGAP